MGLGTIFGFWTAISNYITGELLKTVSSNCVRKMFRTLNCHTCVQKWTRGAVVIYYNYHLGDKHSLHTHHSHTNGNAGYFLPKLTNTLLRILNFNDVTNTVGWTTANSFNPRWLVQNRMISCSSLERWCLIRYISYELFLWIMLHNIDIW